MVSKQERKHVPVLIRAGSITTAALVALVAYILSGSEVAVLVPVAVAELIVAALVIGVHRRDPLWLGLAASMIASVVLFLYALASALGCDDDPSCSGDPGATHGSYIAGAVTLALAAAILGRTVARSARRRSGSREEDRWR